MISMLRSYVARISHCVFVNNCVAARNSKYFVGFLMCASLLLMYILVCACVSVGFMISDDPQIKENASNPYFLYFTIGAMVICVLVLWYLCVLLS